LHFTIHLGTREYKIYGILIAIIVRALMWRVIICEWTGDTRSVHGGRSCRESFVTQWARGGRRALEDTAMFTSQNTEGYAQEELDELNDVLAELLAALTDAERQDKSIVDRVSGKILAHYDMRTVE
jgi:hypothetical protein